MAMWVGGYETARISKVNGRAGPTLLRGMSISGKNGHTVGPHDRGFLFGRMLRPAFSEAQKSCALTAPVLREARDQEPTTMRLAGSLSANNTRVAADPFLREKKAFARSASQLTFAPPMLSSR